MAVLSDAFHLLTDTRTLFLKRLGALLLDSGLVSGQAVQAIQAGAGEHFDEMASTDRRGSFAEEADGLTSSRITLVGEEDLELGIRLDNMNARLFESTGGSLWRTHLRFVTLLRRPDLPKSANPVGPKGIAQGLNVMFAAAGATEINKKLELLDRIEACLLEGLPTLYAEINDFLDRGGVEAAHPTIVGCQEGPASAGASASHENALLALQQALLARSPALAESIQFQPSGGAAASLLSQATVERLLRRLDELDRQVGTPEQNLGSVRASDNMFPELFSSDNSNPPKVIKSAELGIPTTAGEGLAIDTLAMIFEAIFANPTLPDALKAVISSLQITLLKIAMKDDSLFVNEQHPARQVIDRMGQAVLGLPSDVPARHPVCTRLFEIAGHLRSESSSDHAAFDHALRDLDALLAERNAAVAEAARVYLPAIGQLERSDEAASRARLALEPFIEANPPAAIREFIDQSWNKVLQGIWLSHGEQGSEWKDAVAVVADLLWTIAPKADPEERKMLARRLPEILKRLKAGIERLGMTPEALTSFLDACFELQTRALRAAPAPTGSAEPGTPLFASGTFAADSNPVIGQLHVGSLVLATLDFADFQPAPSRPLPCADGDWLEIQLPETDRVIARLCHISPISRRLLFINPDSGLAIAIHPAVVDRQVRSGKARVASASSLFEAAASIALQQTSGH